MRVTTLSNGFQVVTDQMPGLKSAAVGVYVGAGNRHERADQNGIAHFLEHMAFKGTETRSAYQIADTIESVGGFLNAYTSRELTTYFVRILEEDVPLAVELAADIILNSVYDQDEMNLERNVILREIAEIEDSPDDMLIDGLQRTAFPDQPLGRPIIGTAELVSGFERQDLVEFVSEHYRPDRMVLSAAGSVEHEQLVDLAEYHFGKMVSKPRNGTVPGRFTPGEFRREKDIEQAQFALAFKGPHLMHDMDCPARLYSIILGGGSASRLFVEAREKRGLCYSISAQTSSFADIGTFSIYASTGPEELPELVSVCVEELKRSAGDLTEEELARARTQVRVGTLMAFESPLARVERMGGMMALLNKIEGIEDSIARFDAVTLDQVQEFVAGLVTKGDPVLALYGQIAGATDSASLVEQLRE